MLHIIAILLALIGTIIWQLKKVIQNIFRLSDSQALHPRIAEDKVYDNWHKYKKFCSCYDKYNLYYWGLFLIVLAPIIEILPLLYKYIQRIK